MLYDQKAYPSWLDPNGAGIDQEPYQLHDEILILLNIQPESPILTSLAEGQVYATYHFFTLYSGLQNGWRLTISGSNPIETYTVRGVNRFNYGPGQHYEGTLIKDDQ